MSHFRSNRRDLEFNLFEVHRIQDYIGAISDVDPDTARDIVAEVDRLATNEWAASFVDADRHEVELVNREVKLPDSMKASMAAFESAAWGLLGLPEAIGGTPVPPTLFWACQELLLGSNPTAMFYMGGPLFARVLFDVGTPQQQSIARLMIEHNWGGTMVLTEPDAGSDVGAGTTKATHIDGDRYHIEGIKRFITAGEHDGVENIIHFVLARVPGAQEGTKGLSMFIVPKFLFDENGELGERNGVYATNVEKKMGLKGSSTCEMAFGLEHPAVGYLVGGVHDGIRQMFRVIEHARMTIGTKSAATLSTGYLNALEYAKERRQGSDLTEAANKAATKVEIIDHPNVRRMLMLQKAHAEGLRALWSYAAFCQDQALVSDDPEPWEQRSEFLLPLVKGYSSEKAYEMLALSLQVLGGSGYTKDYPMEQYLRDAKIDTVYEGTTGIQALDLFFRKIARDQGVTVSRLSSDIVEFVKGGTGHDGLESERETLGRMLDDTQAHLGVMVGHAMAAVATEPSAIYKTALHASALLESLAEVVIAWQLLRHGEVAMAGAESDPFYAGKLASASFFVAHVAPKIAARRHAAEVEDGALMELAVEAF